MFGHTEVCWWMYWEGGKKRKNSSLLHRGLERRTAHGRHHIPHHVNSKQRTYLRLHRQANWLKCCPHFCFNITGSAGIPLECILRPPPPPGSISPYFYFTCTHICCGYSSLAQWREGAGMPNELIFGDGKQGLAWHWVIVHLRCVTVFKHKRDGWDVGCQWERHKEVSFSQHSPGPRPPHGCTCAPWHRWWWR